MKYKVGKFIKTIVCIIFIMSLSGCWNSRELDTMAIVMGIGLDKPEGEGKVTITAQIVKPSDIGSSKNSGGTSSTSQAFWNIKNSGDTVFGTFRDMTTMSSRKIFFPHNQVIIFGRSLAEEGLQEYIDFFARDPETRVNVLVLVSEGTAEEILDVPSELEKVPAQNIHRLIHAQASNSSQICFVTFREFITRLMSKTTAPVAPMIKITEKGDEKTATLSATAVFKHDKLIGKLDKTEGRGLLWVLGKVKSGIIEIKDKDGELVSVEIVRAGGKIEPEINKGKIKIKVSIDEIGNIGDQSGTRDLSKIEEIESLESKISETIKSEIMSAVKKAKELNADIFGFGDAISQHFPSEWKDLEGKWDEVFPEIEVEVDVQANLRFMGRISSPITPK